MIRACLIQTVWDPIVKKWGGHKALSNKSWIDFFGLHKLFCVPACLACFKLYWREVSRLLWSGVSGIKALSIILFCLLPLQRVYQDRCKHITIPDPKFPTLNPLLSILNHHSSIFLPQTSLNINSRVSLTWCIEYPNKQRNLSTKTRQTCLCLPAQLHSIVLHSWQGC